MGSGTSNNDGSNGSESSVDSTVASVATSAKNDGIQVLATRGGPAPVLGVANDRDRRGQDLPLGNRNVTMARAPQPSGPLSGVSTQ